MVSHDRPGSIVVEHAPHDINCVPYRRTAVDEIADEYSSPFRAGIAPRTVAIPIAKLLQELFQRCRVAMNVTNHIKHSCNWSEGGEEFQA